jgi:ribonuclease G
MLRNLSGMILVDFINLSRAEHREELVNVMKKLVKKDHLHMDVIDLTPLGIMEIVRQKGEKSLEEILKNHFT